MEEARQYSAVTGGERATPEGNPALQTLPITPDKYSIGQLCRLFGVTQRALRYYEGQGLLEPARDGVYRVYGRREYRRLHVIVEGRKLDLTLAQIGKLLDLYTADDGGAAQLDRAVDYVRQRAVALQKQKDFISERLGDLEARLKASRGRPQDSLPSAHAKWRSPVRTENQAATAP
jgi:DNA-binding transcriptional MerR regulator